MLLWYSNGMLTNYHCISTDCMSFCSDDWLVHIFTGHLGQEMYTLVPIIGNDQHSPFPIGGDFFCWKGMEWLTTKWKAITSELYQMSLPCTRPDQILAHTRAWLIFFSSPLHLHAWVTSPPQHHLKCSLQTQTREYKIMYIKYYKQVSQHNWIRNVVLPVQ